MVKFFGIQTETYSYYQSTRLHIPVSCNLDTIVKRTSASLKKNLLKYKSN